MFLQPLDLTTALRPTLLPDEALLFVQDAVGLYEGCAQSSNALQKKALIQKVEQEVQDTQSTKWACIPDHTSSMLRRQCRAPEELGGSRIKERRQI